MTRNYIDITNDYLLSIRKSKEHKVLDLMSFEINGKYIKVDKKFIVLDYSKKEKEVALWIANTLGGTVYMVPRINYPKNIKTADFLWRNEYWDLKEIKSLNSMAINNVLKDSKNQCKNFIIDITNSKNSLENYIRQIENIYSIKHREWINKIILKKRDKLIAVYKRKN